MKDLVRYLLDNLTWIFRARSPSTTCVSSSGGRQPRSEGAPAEADRGQGGRRPADHPRGRAEGAHPDRRERAGHARAALDVLGKLSPTRALIALGIVLAASAATAACDTGKRDNQKTLGPAVLVVSVNVGDKAPLPADGAIQIAFDRYLLPATISRQSVILLDSAKNPVATDLAPIVLYDPIARTVTLAPPKQPWLTEGPALLGPAADPRGRFGYDGSSRHRPAQRSIRSRSSSSVSSSVRRRTYPSSRR